MPVVAVIMYNIKHIEFTCSKKLSFEIKLPLTL